ncbi:MAG: hypothetical protein ACODAB_10380 [Gemmatimonadota bacterium]
MPGKLKGPKKHVPPEKARKILRDGEVNGKPLTEKQKKYFGAIAGGEKPRK